MAQRAWEATSPRASARFSVTACGQINKVGRNTFLTDSQCPLRRTDQQLGDLTGYPAAVIENAARGCSIGQSRWFLERQEPLKRRQEAPVRFLVGSRGQFKWFEARGDLRVDVDGGLSVACTQDHHRALQFVSQKLKQIKRRALFPRRPGE